MGTIKAARTFRSRAEAEVARSYLESFGIKSDIYADDAGNMYSSLQMLRGVELRVNGKDLERATELLDEMEKE